MHTTPDARESIERATSVAEPHARGEMRSHLHEAADRHARGRGADVMEREDVDAVVEEAGGVEALALAFSRRGGPRASLTRRAGAHAIDLAALYGAQLGSWVAVWLVSVGLSALGVVHIPVPTPDPYQIIDADDVKVAGAPAASLLFGLGLGAFLVGIPFAYFLVSDLRGGRTLGKRALGLRAQRVGGVQALARAALKCTPLLAPLLVLAAKLARVVDEREVSEAHVST